MQHSTSKSATGEQKEKGAGPNAARNEKGFRDKKKKRAIFPIFAEERTHGEVNRTERGRGKEHSSAPPHSDSGGTGRRKTTIQADSPKKNLRKKREESGKSKKEESAHRHQPPAERSPKIGKPRNKGHKR